MARYRSNRASSVQNFLNNDEAPDFGGRERPARRRRLKRGKPRTAPGKRGSSKARSREFLEGQLYERDRMDGYRRPPGFYNDEPDESDRYSADTGYSRRIGYRS